MGNVLRPAQANHPLTAIRRQGIVVDLTNVATFSIGVNIGGDTTTVVPCTFLDNYFPVLNDVVYLLENQGDHIVIGSVTRNVPWTNLTYTSNWLDFGGGYDAGQFCKINGIVYLRGLIKTVAAFANAQTFATLPVGCRTANTNGTVYGSGVNSTGATNGNGHRLRVLTDGSLRIEYTTPTTLGGNFTIGGSFVADA